MLQAWAARRPSDSVVLEHFPTAATACNEPLDNHDIVETQALFIEHVLLAP